MSEGADPLDSQFVESNINPLAVLASGGKRFANYLIDIVVLYLLAIVVGFVLGIFGGLSWLDNEIFSRLYGFILYFVYCFGSEAMTGKTVGKLITRTHVVNNSMQRPTALSIAGRSLSRLVPFEVFSFLGGNSRGWHDTWSRTYVIDEKRVRQVRDSIAGTTNGTA